MVATGNSNGYHIDHTEVIDTDNFTSCSNLPAPYPLGLEDAVAMKHTSKIVICGGNLGDSQFTGDCYSYSNDQWNMEAFKLEPPRRAAMSIEIRPGEWLIMGGEAEGYVYLTDTLLLKKGIFTQGPDLPEPIWGGSAVMLNETHLFVAAGLNGCCDDSPRNYLLNINTEQWTQIANRTLRLFEYHASGTFYNSTAGEIQVANIGYHGIEVYSPKDDLWHQLPLPVSMNRSFSIQQGPDSFILIGGQTNNAIFSRDIFLFDEDGFSIIKENVLQVGRHLHIAMPILTDEFTCMI